MKPQITIILGTARVGRQSAKVADYLYNLLQSDQRINLVVADVKDYAPKVSTPAWADPDNQTKPWRDLVAKTQGFILVTPEYNHSFPGELKMLLDQDLAGYQDKPIVVAATSSGNFGGSRVVEHLIPVLNRLGLNVIPHPIYFSNIEELFKNTLEEINKDYQEKAKLALERMLEKI